MKPDASSTPQNTGVPTWFSNADTEDANDKRDTVGVNDPLRFSIKSSKLLERAEERVDAEGPSPREEQPSMRGEMPEGMDRSSWMSEAEWVRGRPSMTPLPEGEGECCSSVEPGPVKKQNLFKNCL